MKLLYCNHCKDIRGLGRVGEEIICKCGRSSGKYTDELNAAFRGADVIPLGIDNSSFNNAIKDNAKRKKGELLGVRFDAFIIPFDAPTIIINKK